MGSMYVTWFKHNGETRSDHIAIEGAPISGEKKTTDAVTPVSTAVAPEGAQYARVWADEAMYIAHGASPTASATTTNIPPNLPIYLTDITPGTTKISGLDVA